MKKPEPPGSWAKGIMDTYGFTVVNRLEAAIQAKWADRLEVGLSGPS